MTLPDPDEKPGVQTLEEKRNALLKLLLTVFAIDAGAVALYLILVYALGWDDVAPFILLIVITVSTGFYFQWQNKKITGR
jgi:CHASE2 domain-containing sensor protein